MTDRELNKFKQIYVRCVEGNSELPIEGVEWVTVEKWIPKIYIEAWEAFLHSNRLFHQDDYDEWLEGLEDIKSVSEERFSQGLPSDKIDVILSPSKILFGELTELFKTQLNKLKAKLDKIEQEGGYNGLDCNYTVDKTQIMFAIFSMNTSPGSIEASAPINPIKQENFMAIKIYNETQKEAENIVKKFNANQGEIGVQAKVVSHRDGSDSDDYFMEGAAFEKTLIIEFFIMPTKNSRRLLTFEELQEFVKDMPESYGYIKDNVFR